MAKKKSLGPRGRAVPKQLKNAAPSPTLPAMNTVQAGEKLERLDNTLSDAIQGAIQGIGGVFPGGFGTQLNQVDTIFRNERWYLISNMRQVLSQFYVEHGLVQTIVDVPVDDGLRGGIEVKSKQLAPEQVEQLLAVIDREDDINTAGQAAKWNRLYGGAGVLIITDQDPADPLDKEGITEISPLEFRAVDMWELFWDKQSTEGYDPTLQEHHFEYYSYYGTKTHKSRVMKLKGLTAPSFIRPRLRGWGFSIVESLVNAINQYLKSNNLTFEVLDEFKLDIYKIKGLTQTLLSKGGTEKVQKRIQSANLEKNYLNALSIDAEDDYIQKQLTFAGIAEMLKEFRMQIACAMRMPLTKIFGISATGFNSGEDDIENYNAMVESQVRAKLKYVILEMVELRCQQLFGFIPTDLSISFKSLRMLSAEQEESVKTMKFSRVLSARTAGEITIKEFRDSVNKDELLPIQLDTDEDTLEDLEDTAEATEGDEGDPGANRAPSANPGPSSNKRQAKEVKEAV